MPPGAHEEQLLLEMGEGFLNDVDGARRGRQPPLPEPAREVFWRLLNENGGARDHLLLAIESGNLQSIVEPYGPGQGMYTAPSRALGINPESLEQAGASRAVEYNLNFTLAHESRHARDRDEILEMTNGMRGAVAAKMLEAELPHDYTEIVDTYLQRDRVLEERAELAGLNAHVSKVLADVGPGATLRDVYERSPKDMAPYIDITPGEGMFGRDTYAYKAGFVVAEDGLHVVADDQRSLDAMGQYFYDAQNYDWRQGMMACLDAINSAEAHHTAITDPQRPPRIDFEALGIGAAPDAHCRGMLQQVVDSNVRSPDAADHPDHAFFVALREHFPDASADAVGSLMLKAKEENIAGPADVNWAESAAGLDGRLWVTGTNMRHVNVDPASPDIPGLMKTAQGLENHAANARDAAEAERIEALQQHQARGAGCTIL